MILLLTLILTPFTFIHANTSDIQHLLDSVDLTVWELAPTRILLPATWSTEKTIRLDETIERMHTRWFTIHNTIAWYNPDGIITREAMARFVVTFMLGQKRQRNHNVNCWFSDIYTANPDLIPSIITACSMNIMRWANGRFSPKASMTKAEVVATLMRMIRNDIGTNVTPWWLNYYNTARAYWITTDSQENMHNQATRWETAIMLRRAFQFID